MNISERRLITHPDDLVKGGEYSVLILDGGKVKRVRGKFHSMEIHYTRKGKKPRIPHLVILMERTLDTLTIAWKQSKDWREL